MKIHIYTLLIISFGLNVVTAQTVLKKIPLKPGKSHDIVSPRAIGVNPITNKIYVGGKRTIHVIDGNTNKASDTVLIENLSSFHISGVGVNPKTNLIYVAGLGGTVDVIDGTTNEVIDSIFVWFGSDAAKSPGIPLFSAEGVAVNPVTNRIYVTYGNSNRIGIIDGDNNIVIGTIKLGLTFAQGIEVNPTTNRIFVTSSDPTTLIGRKFRIIDGETNQVIDTFAIPSTAVDVNPITNRIYVVGIAAIRVIDGDDNKIIDTVYLGDDNGTRYFPIGVNTTTNRYYVANPGHGTVSVVDGETNQVIDTLVVNGTELPLGIAVNPITNLVYVTYTNTDNVVVIKDDGTNKQSQNLSPVEKSFTINCNNNLQTGAAGLEKLVLGLGEDEKCVLKLTHLEPGVPIEITTNLMKGSQSAIKSDPESGITDANGELEFTISAVNSGEDWIAWAALNEKGEFDFSKEAYDAGTAWGMFVEVR